MNHALTLKVVSSIKATDITFHNSCSSELNGYVVSFNETPSVNQVSYTEDIITMDPQTIPSYGWCFIGSERVSSYYSEGVVSMRDA